MTEIKLKKLEKPYRYLRVEANGNRNDGAQNFNESLVAEAKQLGIFHQEVQLSDELKFTAIVTKSPSPHTSVAEVESEDDLSHLIVWSWVSTRDDVGRFVPVPGSIDDLASLSEHQQIIATILASAQQAIYERQSTLTKLSTYGATGHVARDRQIKLGVGRGSQSNQYHHFHLVNLEIPISDIKEISTKTLVSEAELVRIRAQQLKNEAPRNEQWWSVVGDSLVKWLSDYHWAQEVRIANNQQPSPTKNHPEQQLLPLYEPMGLVITPSNPQSNWSLVEAYEILLSAYAKLSKVYDLVVESYDIYWQIDPALRSGEITQAQPEEQPDLKLEDIFAPSIIEQINKMIKRTKPSPQQLAASSHGRSGSLSRAYQRLESRMESLSGSNLDQKIVLRELVEAALVPKQHLMSEQLSSVWSMQVSPSGRVEKIIISPSFGTTKSGFEHLTGYSIER